MQAKLPPEHFFIAECDSLGCSYSISHTEQWLIWRLQHGDNSEHVLQISDMDLRYNLEESMYKILEWIRSIHEYEHTYEKAMVSPRRSSQLCR